MANRVFTRRPRRIQAHIVCIMSPAPGSAHTSLTVAARKNAGSPYNAANTLQKCRSCRIASDFIYYTTVNNHDNCLP
ncbi:hypothetical protein [Chitinophaga solisilvae]|uniref:hypothetical protein n=1 Tax=Chitinophaga solisilvae TaxID=1233460 RepID=UPI001F426BAF|nr:hypothetical protein [Chitinophaga solisilvae]